MEGDGESEHCREFREVFPDEVTEEEVTFTYNLPPYLARWNDVWLCVPALGDEVMDHDQLLKLHSISSVDHLRVQCYEQAMAGRRTPLPYKMPFPSFKARLCLWLGFDNCHGLPFEKQAPGCGHGGGHMSHRISFYQPPPPPMYSQSSGLHWPRAAPTAPVTAKFLGLDRDVRLMLSTLVGCDCTLVIELYHPFHPTCPFLLVPVPC